MFRFGSENFSPFICYMCTTCKHRRSLLKGFGAGMFAYSLLLVFNVLLVTECVRLRYSDAKFHAIPQHTYNISTHIPTHVKQK